MCSAAEKEAERERGEVRRSGGQRRAKMSYVFLFFHPGPDEQQGRRLTACALTECKPASVADFLAFLPLCAASCLCLRAIRPTCTLTFCFFFVWRRAPISRVLPILAFLYCIAVSWLPYNRASTFSDGPAPPAHHHHHFTIETRPSAANPGCYRTALKS